MPTVGGTNPWAGVLDSIERRKHSKVQRIRDSSNTPLSQRLRDHLQGKGGKVVRARGHGGPERNMTGPYTQEFTALGVT